VVSNSASRLAWASGLEQFKSLGAGVCEGVYFGTQYWHTVDVPLNRQLVQLCRDQLGINPNYSLASVYMGTKLLLEAIDRAGMTDTEAVISALEG